MPYYFGNIVRSGSNPEGCSASQCTPDGSAPSDPSEPMCKIYKSQQDELGKVDSCTNVKALNNLQCPISSASKQIIPVKQYNGTAAPALLTCTYVPPNNMTSGMPTTCYDYPRADIYLDALYTFIGRTDLIPDIKKTFEARMKVDVLFCSASKAYYIDKTLSQADVKGLPGSSEKSKC